MVSYIFYFATEPLIKSTISKSPWGYAAVVAWEEAPRIKKGYDETKNQDFY
ncbi:TPA: hypothetical protein ACOG6T_002645 [Staphylococcus aureus]